MKTSKYIEGGTFFKKKNGYGDWIRQTLNGGEDADTVLYLIFREPRTPSHAALQSGCSAGNLRVWGNVITEEEARRLVPDMDEQRALYEKKEAERTKQMLSLALWSCSTEELIEEIKLRGYTVKQKAKKK